MWSFFLLYLCTLFDFLTAETFRRLNFSQSVDQLVDFFVYFFIFSVYYAIFDLALVLLSVFPEQLSTLVKHEQHFLEQ